MDNACDQDKDDEIDDSREESSIFGDKHETVVWFWQCMRDFKQDEVRAVLAFFTGSSRVPVDGYEPPLNLTEGVDMVNDSLPKAHTCFNQIVLQVQQSGCYEQAVALRCQKPRLSVRLNCYEGFCRFEEKLFHFDHKSYMFTVFIYYLPPRTLAVSLSASPPLAWPRLQSAHP